MRPELSQEPLPGSHTLCFCGDTVTFTLTLSEPQPGAAFLRANIGQAAIARREIIRAVRHNESPLGRDWFDLPMRPLDDRRFQITLPLCEVGHFEAKAFFLPTDQPDPLWVSGPNTVVNVSPAGICAANIIYNAFVRQFGPNRDGRFASDALSGCMQPLDAAGYTVIPPSGTFRDLIRELDFIIGKLGCRIIQLLPIYPSPTTYGRMGRFGSPYAALSFTAVDPALAEFDSKATPLDQFIELVHAIHARNALLIIDIAINHCGWAANLHETHPEWLVRDPEGRIEVPGAWGVRWEDLTRLDYARKDLWHYMAEVFLTWCRRGVDGFRCDAGYMIPIAAWKYVIALVRKQFPDTVFFLEGLGGKPEVTYDLLNEAGFDWAYSELFQNYDRSQIEHYLPPALHVSAGDGLMVHYAETHDNDRLAARSQTFARMRTSLCALSSHLGGFGFANGVEWYATEKINVHESPSLNWGAAVNQVAEIERLSAILKHHPAFGNKTELKIMTRGEGNSMVLHRRHLKSQKELLIVANLDATAPGSAAWEMQAETDKGPVFTDLLSGQTVTPRIEDRLYRLNLDPGQVLCLTPDPNDPDLISTPPHDPFTPPLQMIHQAMRAKALEVFSFYNGCKDLGDFDPDQAARSLGEDPLAFCTRLNLLAPEPRVVSWRWPEDRKREVMVPPDHFLLVSADVPFQGCIVRNRRVIQKAVALPKKDGTYFALFTPLPAPKAHLPLHLKLYLYTASGCEEYAAPLLFLAPAEKAFVQQVFRAADMSRTNLSVLETNGSGGMLKIPVLWGTLNSRYDALLAANPDPQIPVDRWIMLTRLRIWVVFQDYSQELGPECLESYSTDAEGKGEWRFHVPTGRGRHVIIMLTLTLEPGENRLYMHLARPGNEDLPGCLDDCKPVRVVIRPDMENRNFHHTTKAYLSNEHQWPAWFKLKPSGFRFQPDPAHQIEVQISEGGFISEPEWIYMVHRPLEAERGLDPDSDLFSPGYFETHLKGGKSVTLTAYMPYPRAATGPKDPVPQTNAASPARTDIPGLLARSLDRFVVRRGNFKSVIAGYPWFLDWGRDSLIVSRGLIAAGRLEAARNLLQQFGRFEENGTLPNMIQGDDAQNRDTSDAPLWLCAACKALVQAERDECFLDAPCGERTVREVLLSIGNHYINGTPNGIRMDPGSGLIFSPAHFTWMDTDHPAGTPREGYPIEIQALWSAALTFLAHIDSSGKRDWKGLAAQVRASIHQYFYMQTSGYLSDCLHATPDTPAGRAEADDALRPNQLLAVTLNAIDNEAVCRHIVSSCEALIVPGAIRSLADRKLRRPLKIVHNGKLLTDPYTPYAGKYVGDEDTQRKPAYHNGTAWTWLFPVFCEAWFKAYGETARAPALARLSSMIRLLNSDCIGHVPELLDGDFPHTSRGCDAQAWGISELLRVWMKLSE